MAIAKNDDELEHNWVDVGLEVAVDDDDVVSLGSEDEMDDDDEVTTNSLKRALNDDDNDDAPAKIRKKQKMAKPSKGLHKMTTLEHFKIVNDAYTRHRGGQMTTLELAEGLSGMYCLSYLICRS